MYENDYIMRMIHDMIRALAKIIFHKDIDEWEQISFRDEEAGKLFSELDGLLYKKDLKGAQSLLESRLDVECLENLKVALLFYDRLNQLEDSELEEYGNQQGRSGRAGTQCDGKIWIRKNLGDFLL